MFILINRMEEIKKKGFSMGPKNDTADVYSLDFSKIQTGLKTLDNANLNLGSYRRIDPSCGDK